MNLKNYSQLFAVTIVVAVASISFGVQRAEAAVVPYTGEVTAADGTVATLLGALPIPAAGEGTFNSSNAFISMNMNVGAFFFSSLWTGNCTAAPSDGTCATTDPDIPTGSTFVPLLSVLSNTLTFDANGVPDSGSIVMDSFSVTFGLPLGDITLDQSGGVFSLAGGILGGASGTGSFQAVPVPAAVWMFGSALGLLGWMRRRVSA